MNLGQTDWSDDESDDEVKVENIDPENDEVTDANKGLVMKLEYHRLLWPNIRHFDMSRFKCRSFDQTSAISIHFRPENYRPLSVENKSKDS